MARYEITAPDGSRYEITAPDDASESDVMSYAKQSFKTQDSREMSPEESVPQWGRDNPNLYGAAGAARETLGPVAEALGLGGGAMVGTASAGPVGGAIGAGLGYGAAKEFTGKADVALGNTPQQGLADQLRNAAGNVAEGSAIEMGGQSVVPAAKALYEGGKVAASSLIGDVGTGMGSETMRQLGAAGQAGGKRMASALSSMRNKGDMESVVMDAKSALKNMNERRTAEYLAGMKNIEGADKPLDFKIVDSAFKDIVDSFKYKGTWKVGKETQAKISEIQKTVDDWRNKPELHTTMGFDALKQRINDLMPNKLDAGKSGMAVTKMYNAIKNTITKESPEYAKVMKDFETSIKSTKEIEKELSLSDRASVGTALRKLQSVTRNNANTNYGNRADMVKSLEEGGGSNIIDRLAGQSAATWTPRGLSRIGAQGAAIGASTMNPMVATAIPFMSPRLMGEAAVKGGQLAGALSRGGRAIGITPELVRAASKGATIDEINRQRLLAEQLRRK